MLSPWLPIILSRAVAREKKIWRICCHPPRPAAISIVKLFSFWTEWNNRASEASKHGHFGNNKFYTKYNTHHIRRKGKSKITTSDTRLEFWKFNNRKCGRKGVIHFESELVIQMKGIFGVVSSAWRRGHAKLIILDPQLEEGFDVSSAFLFDTPSCYLDLSILRSWFSVCFDFAFFWMGDEFWSKPYCLNSNGLLSTSLTYFVFIGSIDGFSISRNSLMGLRSEHYGRSS